VYGEEVSRVLESSKEERGLEEEVRKRRRMWEEA
jgi:hypothetical protein